MLEQESLSSSPDFLQSEFYVDTTECQANVGLCIQYHKVRQNFNLLQQNLKGFRQFQKQSFKKGEILMTAVGKYFCLFYLDHSKKSGFAVFSRNPNECPPNAIFDYLDFREGIDIHAYYNNYVNKKQGCKSPLKAEVRLVMPDFEPVLINF